MDHHWNKKWKMEWNCECTHLQLTLVTWRCSIYVELPWYISMAVISSQKCYEHLWCCSNASILKHGTVTSSSSSASIAKPDSHTKSKSLALRDYSYEMSLWTKM